MVSSGVQKAADGKTDVEKCLLSNGHVMSIPLRESYGMYGSAVQIYGQNIYVISGEGFFKAKLTAKKFTQIYGISNFDGMQESEVTFSLAMKNEKEIYLMSEKTDWNEKHKIQGRTDIPLNDEGRKMAAAAAVGRQGEATVRHHACA